MLVFVTSVRHPVNSCSFDRVVDLLNLSLKSILSQTNPGYEIVVVANAGSITRTIDRIHYVNVNFPAPSDAAIPTTGMSAIQIDRGTKYAAGLLYAKKLKPSYIMFFDCDDLLHNGITEYVNRNPGMYGWYIDKGYSLKVGCAHLNPIMDFHKRCGTSHIFQYNSLKSPRGVSYDSCQASIIEAFGRGYIKSVLGSHRLAVKMMHDIGRDLEPLPFFGAIWVLGTGENHSGNQGKSGTSAITDSIKYQFSIPDSYID